MRPGIIAAVSVGLACAMTAACGSSPSGPSPGPGPGPTPNAAPVIETIAASATRTEVETDVTYTVTVRDAETAVDQLKFEWKADAGTFTGEGALVKWRAPKNVATPADYTVTLTVTETYGTANALGVRPQNTVTGSAPVVRVHDSPKEVGDMSRQFLVDFSDTSIKDVNYIMRNFGAGSRCPEPAEVASERDDVVNNFTNYDIKAWEVGQPATTVNFGGFCPLFGRLGDACSVVPVMWDSVDKRTGKRGVTRGDDVISAAYSSQESRWWLCSSRYREYSTIGTYRFIR